MLLSKPLLFLVLLNFHITILHPEKLLNDQAALEYCRTHPKSFIAIIWPIAQGKSKKIKATFNAYGKIKYQKTAYFSPARAHYILQMAHPHIPDIQEHIAWYFPPGTYDKPARIFVVTYDNALTAVTCKHAIRKLFPGLQYRSIHTNDTHAETVELANYFFK